jgi:hypothetical protein
VGAAEHRVVVLGDTRNNRRSSRVTRRSSARSPRPVSGMGRGA